MCLDLSELEVVARVGELDRANLTEGQDVVIHLDALPNKELHGKIKSLSGTATADVYSNDPAKKFDVTFEINMDELMSALGATPEQVARIRQTAERNRNRGVTRSSGASSMMGGDGCPAVGCPGGGMPGGGFAGASGFGGGGNEGGFAGGGGGESGGFAGRGGSASANGGQRGTSRRPRNTNPTQIISRLPDEEKQKAQEILDKALAGKQWDDLAADKKNEVMQQLRPMMAAAFTGGRGGGAAGGGLPALPGSRSGAERFTAAQIAAAALPPPPEEDSQLDVLLRPGLSGRRGESRRERIPDAIHIPVQAVFERDGQPMVYVKDGKRFEEREVRPLKRSESMMVIADGLKEGEVIALADPTAKPGEGNDEGAAGGEQSGMGRIWRGGGGGG